MGFGKIKWAMITIGFSFQSALAESDAVVIVPLYSSGSMFIEQGNESTGPIAALRSLVENQQWTTARFLADELLDAWEGNARFDLYYGILLINEGFYDEAIFAFERVLLIDPNQLRARAELGRTYFYNHNYQRARQELELVLAANPPVAVRTNIRTILNEIDRAERRFEISNVLGASVTVGWDSNANNGTQLTGPLDPNLLGLTELADVSSPIQSSFARWSVNYAMIEPISQTSSRRLLADFTQQIYLESTIPSTQRLSLGAFVNHQTQRSQQQWPITVAASWINQDFAQISLDAGLQWQHNLWGPIWAGPNVQTSVNISTHDSTTTNVNDLAGVRFRVSEHARVHTFAVNYLRFHLAGVDDGHLEWQGMSNVYRVHWPLMHRIGWQQELEHQWRWYNDNDLIFTLNETSTDTKTRSDQLLRLTTTIHWTPTDWLMSETQIYLEWLESNINAYSRSKFTISQALRMQF